jgi:hypothetical protein
MQSSISDAKRANAVQDTASERWSRLYVDVRASARKGGLSPRSDENLGMKF